MALTSLCTPYCGVDLDEKVHVVGHGFQLHQPRSFLIDDFPDDLFQACLHASADDPAPVFGAPHHVERALEDDVRGGALCDPHTAHYIAGGPLTIEGVAARGVET